MDLTTIRSHHDKILLMIDTSFSKLIIIKYKIFRCKTLMWQLNTFLLVWWCLEVWLPNKQTQNEHIDSFVR